MAYAGWMRRRKSQREPNHDGQAAIAQRRGELMSNYWEGETPAERESRLALAACLNADMIFRGVRDGLCYFEVYFTDDPNGPKAVLSLPTDGLTAEKIAKHAAGAESTADPELGQWRCPNGHDSCLPPPLPELFFTACEHYTSEATWNEFCIACGVRHEPLAIYWHTFRMADHPVQNPKNYCGYCGAKMVTVRASR